MSPAVWIKKLFTLRLVKCEEYVRGAARVTLVTYNTKKMKHVRHSTL